MFKDQPETGDYNGQAVY